MFGFPDSEKCPITLSGNASMEEIQAANAYALGVYEWITSPIFGQSKPLPCPVPDYVKAEYNKTKEQRITVNKTTHRIRFENETESSVDVVISEKETAELK